MELTSGRFRIGVKQACGPYELEVLVWLGE